MSGSAKRLCKTLQRLQDTLETRKGADPSASHTARLLSKGVGHAAKKLGEEAVETVIAAVERDADALAAESADLLYHWMVTLMAVGVPLDAVAAKLEAREGVSGLTEKAGRKSD